MPHKFRKSQLIAFDDAAAGHQGVLSIKTGEILVKPCKQAEIDFYQAAMEHQALKQYMPEYMGCLQLNQQEANENSDLVTSAEEAGAGPQATVVNSGILERPKSSGGGAIPVTETWTPSGGAAISADSGIVMENVAHGYKKPNILDVKLGARLWDDDSPEEKRDRLDKVAAETTSKPLGYRIAGMKTYAGRDAEPIRQDTKGYRKYDKAYGRKFTVDDVHTAFREFFFVEEAGVTDRLGKKIVKRFLQDLEALLEVLENEETRMYSASLLFVYEGDGEALAEKFVKEAEGIDAINNPKDSPSDAATVEQSKESGSEEASDESTALDANAANPLPKLQTLKMIDFAHARFVKGQGPDENVLHGIRNVIKTLGQITQQQQH